ncbi:cytochrome c oxidase subunit II [Mesorhizobium sp. WSM4313]|uniref:cytochrome c oxidase subunit II n=1 Tax=Mesorhizobium sp. WSM4313 TaxID=2029412 RepID=UPI000BB09FAB|nr:cytochrome c oxidase subunit II [Mesorhizobium sp. WSM4313]PBB18013.1 cytochrome c oxidase subunit II [Mesorhizobium sp. WSM4313]
MHFRRPYETWNFGTAACPGLLSQLWRVDAAKQKNAADQAEGEECRNVEPVFAENPDIAFQTHGSASSTLYEAHNTERDRRVPDLVFRLFRRASNWRALASLPAAAGALASGCTGVQSALDPHGEQADALAVLFWIFTAVLGLVWLVTMAGLFFALTRRRDSRGEPAQARPAVKRQVRIAFAAMLASTVIILSGLTVLSFDGQRMVFRDEAGAAVTISVIGHQWWWQVRYEGNNGFETANEIRIPVGSAVDIKLTTGDVIHSFWIPSLAGKLDLIPGKSNELRIQADKPGVYRGQCAEFCGQQHAHMAIFVVALEPSEFERWRAKQAAPARPMAHLTKQQNVFASAASSPSPALSEHSR